MAVCYVLRCVDGSYYVGSTDDLDARLTKHTDGSASSANADSTRRSARRNRLRRCTSLARPPSLLATAGGRHPAFDREPIGRHPRCRSDGGTPLAGSDGASAGWWRKPLSVGTAEVQAITHAPDSPRTPGAWINGFGLRLPCIISIGVAADGLAQHRMRLDVGTAHPRDRGREPGSR